VGVADRWKDWDEPQQQGGVRFSAPRLTSAVKLILLVNLGFFLALWLVPKFFGSGAHDATTWCVNVFGLFPADWSAPYLPVWQLLTHGVLHDPGSLGHIFWNSLLLYFFGTMLEGMLGARRFLVAYLCCMLSGAAFHCLGFLLGLGEFDKTALGASGAILGVVVACAVYKPNQSVLFFFIPVKLKVLVGCLVLFDVFWLIEGMSGTNTGTAHWIHLGGAGCGFFGARLGWFQRDLFARFQARRAIRVEEKRKGDDELVDQLLQKISEEGLGSLSEKEKATLKRASERPKG